MRSGVHFLRDLWGSALVFTGSHRWVDALLGARCRMGCGARVFPRDVTDHEATHHAWERA